MCSENVMKFSLPYIFIVLIYHQDHVFLILDYSCMKHSKLCSLKVCLWLGQPIYIYFRYEVEFFPIASHLVGTVGHIGMAQRNWEEKQMWVRDIVFVHERKVQIFIQKVVYTLNICSIPKYNFNTGMERKCQRWCFEVCIVFHKYSGL